MKSLIKLEFQGSDVHQQLFEILLKKYNILTEKKFNELLSTNKKFSKEYNNLVNSYNDFISDSVEE
jgi:hypothetical protein